MGKHPSLTSIRRTVGSMKKEVKTEEQISVVNMKKTSGEVDLNDLRDQLQKKSQ